MRKLRKIDFSTWSIDGYGNDLPPLGGYVCLIGALQMWCKIILAALLEIRKLYEVENSNLWAKEQEHEYRWLTYSPRS